MTVFRLVREKYLADFSGKGAAIGGARWNSKGTEIIYTSQSRALAMAEVAVHLSLDSLPNDFMMLEIDLPEKLSIQTVSIEALPAGWGQFPPSVQTQFIGDQFILENKVCLLRVPSAVVKGDYNILVNPFHPEFSAIRIIGHDKFPFDTRYISH